MTVAELIELLQGFPGDMLVVRRMDEFAAMTAVGQPAATRIVPIDPASPGEYGILQQPSGRIRGGFIAVGAPFEAVELRLAKTSHNNPGHDFSDDA